MPYYAVKLLNKEKEVLDDLEIYEEKAEEDFDGNFLFQLIVDAYKDNNTHKDDNKDEYDDKNDNYESLENVE